jgi:hypothetical protein
VATDAVHVRCTECQAVVASVRKRHDEGSGRWQLDLLDGCEHAATADIRIWFFELGALVAS